MKTIRDLIKSKSKRKDVTTDEGQIDGAQDQHPGQAQSVDDNRPKAEELPDDEETVQAVFDQILAIKVHHTDPLKEKMAVVHPVVKIHLFDINTGSYVRKSDESNRVTYHIEKSSTILPVTTQPTDLNKFVKPTWEEFILINESFEYLTGPGRALLVIFELMDFSDVAELKPASEVSPEGWKKVGWAFLKVKVIL